MAKRINFCECEPVRCTYFPLYLIYVNATVIGCDWNAQERRSASFYDLTLFYSLRLAYFSVLFVVHWHRYSYLHQLRNQACPSLLAGTTAGLRLALIQTVLSLSAVPHFTVLY